MWCSACGQDVPGIAGAEPGQFGCARCGTPVGVHESDGTLASRPAVSDHGVELTEQRMSRLAEVPPLLELEASELDELVSRARKWTSASAEPAEPRELRIDTEHAVASPAIPGNIRPPRDDGMRASSRRAAGLATGFAWLGLVVLVSGGGLAVQSRIAHRVELWNLGLPLLIAGTAAALTGLVIRAWLSAGAPPARLLDTRVTQQPRPNSASPHGASSSRAGSARG